MNTPYQRLKIVKPITNWLAFCFMIYILPIMAAPLILLLNIGHFGLLTAIFETFWSSYTVIYKYCMPICLGSVPIFIWIYSFRADISEASFLYETIRTPKTYDSWLKHTVYNHYLLSNRDLSIAYGNYLSSAEYKDIFDFQTYLQITHPSVLYKYTSSLSFIPEWMTVQNVAGHTRRGHTRYTKNGPIEISQHNVRAHTRVRR